MKSLLRKALPGLALVSSIAALGAMAVVVHPWSPDGASASSVRLIGSTSDAGTPTTTRQPLLPILPSLLPPPSNPSVPTPTLPLPTSSVPPTSGPALPPGPTSKPNTTPGPGREWTLTASSLTLSGSQYHGFSDQMVAGKKVRTMHFTVSALHITDLVQRGDLGNGKVLTVAAAPGSVSTITPGPIELFGIELDGTLAVAGFPVAPIRLAPDALLPPNVDASFLQLPDLTFKNVVAHNADLNGGTLVIPGAKVTLS